MALPDIDIDFADRTQALELFTHTPAKLKQRKHNTGVYFHRVPSNPFTDICTVEHTDADKYEFFKLDLFIIPVSSVIIPYSGCAFCNSSIIIFSVLLSADETKSPGPLEET